VTDGGVDVGSVVDVVIEVTDGRAGVVGYEIEPGEGFEPAHGSRGRRLYIPWADSLAASSEAVIVPAAAVDYIADDFAGFGAAIEGFRSRLQAGER
jgi:sporulation protein YlmC with PRC-barrel domain